MVNLALAFAIFLTGTCDPGFALYAIFTGFVALAFASKHRDVGEPGDADFSGTLLAWVSFAVIAAVFTLILGAYLAFKPSTGATAPRLGGAYIGVSILVLISFFTLVGLVSSLFDYQFFDKSNFTAGDNFNAPSNVNYGNAVSPFAWPISIWSSVVGAAFCLATIIKGSPSTGITALAFTEAANLVGWAANHVYFGSRYNDSIEGLSRAWGAVALGAGVITILLAIRLLRSDHKTQEAAPADEAPAADDFANQGHK